MPIDVDFRDILDSLEAGVLARYRGASERYGVVVDVIYLDLGKSREDAVLQRADLQQLVVDVTGAYRFSSVVEAFAGVRITDVDTKLQLGLPAFPEAGRREPRGPQTFYDPIVGARVASALDASIPLAA